MVYGNWEAFLFDLWELFRTVNLSCAQLLLSGQMPSNIQTEEVFILITLAQLR